MATLPIKTLTVTINAPFEQVARDLADAKTHPEWGTEFFRGEPRAGEGDEIVVFSPFMGTEVRFRVEADLAHGSFDLYLAPIGEEFGPPLPVRLLHNGDGVDVLWTLTRFPGTPDERWEAGLVSMERELQNLKQRHEKK
ncbi:MAG: hypothetical protein E2O74_03610 [Chloroflexi bacterium]|nr:MAG: hypothetical protein E2O74_03610 [Chloroflexota bacterium]